MTIAMDSPLPDGQPCELYNAARQQIISAASMSEAALLARVMYLCDLYGLLCYHTADSRGSRPGFPDLVIVSENGDGQVVLIRELKVNGGKLSFDQKRWGRALRAAGEDYAVWTPEDYASRRITCELAGLSRLAAMGQLPVPPDVEQLTLDEVA